MATAVGPGGPVEAFRLGNGLRVLLAPRPGASTVSVWVWYRVGSKNEWPGATGASHWVEHMMFNGSPRFPKGVIDRAVMDVGGQLNAFTDVDFTAYLTTVPAEHAMVPIRIEADRMTRARMTEAEVERERSIVLSERDGNENWPEFRADEELYELAFRHHPYRWDPLGFRSDIERMDARRLADYYRRFYGPRNATLVVVGRFEPRRLAREVRRRFGGLPATGERPEVGSVEPPQRGERSATLTGPGTTPFLMAGYRTPGIRDPQTPAHLLLDTLLGGETRLFSGSGWGRGGEHPSARLYRSLVEPGLAVRASSEWRPREHPGLFVLHVQAASGVTLSRVEEVLAEEMRRVAAEGPTPRELAEIREKIRASARLAYEGPTRTAFRLGYFAQLGDPGFESRLLRGLLRTPARAIRDAAARLFRPDSRVVVRYLPTPEAPRAR